MPAQQLSSSQESHSEPLPEERRDPTAQGPPTPTLTMIFIDHSYAVYNNYHNSQNQTTTETVNSNNHNSTRARNSTLNGDSRWSFRAEAPAQHPPASSTREYQLPTRPPVYSNGPQHFGSQQTPPSPANEFVPDGLFDRQHQHMNANHGRPLHPPACNGLSRSPHQRHNSWPPGTPYSGTHPAGSPSPGFESNPVTPQPCFPLLEGISIAPMLPATHPRNMQHLQTIF
ncbi:hypothetical protein H1R20_g1531, partial [Candolleomyces eurysporus]